MAIKTPSVLSKEDFETALVTLRLSVSEVSRESGIPRHQLSHFRNYGDGLKPEQAAKLRDYLEDKGIEFADEEEPMPERATTAKNEQPAFVAPHPRLEVAQAMRCYFPISDEVPDSVVANALDLMEEADARLVALFKTNTERDSGFFGSGEFTDDTKATLQEAFGLLAGNYLIFRMLRGWRALNIAPTTEAPETIRDVVLTTFKQHLIDAGLMEAETTEPAQSEATETENEEAEA